MEHFNVLNRGENGWKEHMNYLCIRVLGAEIIVYNFMTVAQLDKHLYYSMVQFNGFILARPEMADLYNL